MAFNNINPITRLDYPDPDIIFADSAYYMVSTTMYFMPGCEILRSYDLMHWEHAAYVFDRLDSTDAQRLEGKENIYGQGMWAASIRYHDGFFFVCFVCNDTHKTYVYTSRSITGPWEKSTLNGFYHDNSILFDEDGRIYIISGNREIHLSELFLKKTVQGVTLTDVSDEHLTDTITDSIIIKDSDDAHLGYEGAHFYKIDGRYYIFLIHIPASTARRTESCFVSDNVAGPYVGMDVMDDDMGFRGMGVAQGGIVQTPSGKWYGILFQDSGAVGRIPILIPVSWKSMVIGTETVMFPIFGADGKIPVEFEIEDLNPGYNYAPLVGSDNFRDVPVANGQTESLDPASCGHDSFGFRSFWQFNHEPDLSLIKRNNESGSITITTNKLCDNLVQAKNIITQRTLFPGCRCHADIDATNLGEGDYAGLCVLESCYCFIAVTKRDGKFYLVQGSREITTGGFWGERHDTEEFVENSCISLDEPHITLHSSVCYDHASLTGSDASDLFMHPEIDDCAFFAYSSRDFNPKAFGPTCRLQFKLDHFTGARFGLFVYSTKEAGGSADFSNFIYCPI